MIKKKRSKKLLSFAITKKKYIFAIFVILSMEKISEGFKGEKIIRTPKSIWQLQAANMICKQMYITDIGYYPHAKYHFYAQPNGRIENVLLYCVDGQGWIKCNDTVHTLKRHQAFVIPSLHTHAYGANQIDPWSIYWFHFCGENVSIFNSIYGQIVHLENSDISRYDDRIQLFEEMYQNLKMGYSPENLEYVCFCLMHFLASLKYINQFREIKKAKQTNVIQKSIMFMKDNLEEIAYRMGYYDSFHFSKAFKQEMEITPKEYRRRYADMNESVETSRSKK